MRLFSSGLVLIFMHFFQEVEEASGFLKRIITDVNATKREEDRANILATPRPKKLTALTQYSTSSGHQALDRHGDDHPPYILESSHQFSSAEASDLMNKFKTNPGRSSKIDPSTRRIQRDQIQHPNLMDNDALQQRQGNSRQGSVDFGGRAHLVPQSGDKALGFHDPHRSSNVRNSNNPINIPEGQGKGKSKTKESSKNQTHLGKKPLSFSQHDVDGNTLNLHATTKIEHEKKKCSHVSADIVEARRIYSLPFSQHSRLIKPKPFDDKQPIDFKKQYREKEALNLFEMYYPDGVPSPEFLSDHSGGSGSGS